MTTHQELRIRGLRQKGWHWDRIAKAVEMPLEIVAEVCEVDRRQAQSTGRFASGTSFWFGEAEVPAGEVVRCVACGAKLTHVLRDGLCRACVLQGHLEGCVP